MKSFLFRFWFWIFLELVKRFHYCCHHWSWSKFSFAVSSFAMTDGALSTKLDWHPTEITCMNHQLGSHRIQTINGILIWSFDKIWFINYDSLNIYNFLPFEYSWSETKPRLGITSNWSCAAGQNELSTIDKSSSMASALETHDIFSNGC